MNKIGNALHEIQTIDSIARRHQWVNALHPLIKLSLTLFYMIMVVSFDRYHFFGLLGMIVYPLIVFELAQLSLIHAVYKLRFILPFVCFVGLLNPIFDNIPITSFWGITLTSGMISMSTLMLKGVLTVLSSYLLIATTTIEDICYALRLLHIPKLLVTQILLIYRYLSVLLSEANRMTQAYSLRAPRQKGVHFKVWGSLAGLLLLRSMDRANELYESMCLRGYHGEFYYSSQKKIAISDILYWIIWIIIILVFRIFPIFELIGGLFV